MLDKDKITAIIWIIMLLVGFFFVSSALKGEEVEMIEDKKEKKEVEVKPAEVKLIVNSASGSIEYSVKLFNTESVGDLLEYLRLNQGFTYEKIAYIYGTELDNINGVKAPEGYKWEVYSSAVENNKDITYEIDKINLADGEIYELKLEKVE